jgi:transcriptional regulator with XRE-family HTH domain
MRSNGNDGNISLIGNDFDIDYRIGLIIKRLRQVANITQSELARQVGVSQSTISLIETGQRNNRSINLRVFQRIARVIGFSRLSDLISFAEDISSPEAILERLHSFRQENNRCPDTADTSAR